MRLAWCGRQRGDSLRAVSSPPPAARFSRLWNHGTHGPGLVHTAAPGAKTSRVCRKSQHQPRAAGQSHASRLRWETPCHRAMHRNDLKHQNGAERLADETRGFRLQDDELKLAIRGFQKEDINMFYSGFKKKKK